MPINMPQQKSGSPLQGLMQMFQGVKGATSSGGSAAVGSTAKPETEAPAPESTAMDRRMESASQDPQAMIEQGLSHANDPSVPLDYETRLAVFEPLLRAKHYGYGGGADSGQGSIKSMEGSGKSPVAGAAGMVGSVAALA